MRTLWFILTFCLWLGVLPAQSVPRPTPPASVEAPCPDPAPALDSLPTPPESERSAWRSPTPSVYEASEPSGRSGMLLSLLRMFLRLYE